MAQKINLLGVWANVPGVYLPAESGQAYFADPTITTATEPDVAQGKRFLKADGSIGTGTGGSPTIRLQAKTKTYTPTTSEQSEDVTPDSGYDGLSKVSVTVGAIQTESKSATPSETAQTITPSSGKFLSSVSVGAIPDNYVGTGIARRSSSDLSASGATVSVPAGYYSAQASKSVSTTTHPNPGVSINSDGLITATHTQGTGYVTGGTTTATQQLAKRTSADLTASGATVTAPAGYYPEAASKSIASGSASTPTTTITATPSITVDGETGEITASVSASRSITPTVSAGYVSTGTAGTVTASGSATHQLTVIDDTQIEGRITERTGTFAFRSNVVDIPAGWSPGLSPVNLFPEMVVSTVNGYSIDTSGNLTFNFSPQTAGIAYRTKSYEVTGNMQVEPGATITPSRQQQTAIMADHYATGAILVDPIPSNYIIPSGTKQITANGTGIDVTSYAAVDVAVPSGSPNLQTKSVSYTPTESAQSGTVSPDSGYDGLSSVSVSVGAISSTYVGTGITRRTSSSMTEAQGVITAPAGYYASDATHAMQDAGHPDPTISVSATGLITATHVQPEGYTQGGTARKTQQLDTEQGITYTPDQTGAALARAGQFLLGDIVVDPIPGQYVIPTGSTTITENGTWDVSDFEEAVVNVAAAGGGLEYETGIWTPDESIARGTIEFQNQHSEPPIAVLMADGTGTTHSATQSNYLWVFFDAQRFTGNGYPYSSSGYRYAAAYYSYRANSTSSISSTATLMSQQTTSTSASGVNYPKYWADATAFYPYSGSTGRTWKSGRSYHWIAIWKP